MYRLIISCYTAVFQSVSLRTHFFRRNKHDGDQNGLTLDEENDEDELSLSDDERMWQQLRSRINSEDERNANPPTIVVSGSQVELDNERPEVISEF
ncbi:unnamed protein product [Toxocara canis]|uniref:Anaphase-promoting complex subunit 13 n=1 Tax=Toxocara canis TaxID=6265 RepID=A0A183U330_TOXCA|nr:unnamed protein product [Toxocara canis]